MKWLSTKTHRPSSNAGECFVATEDHDLWIATYRYIDSIEEYDWMAEDGHILGRVTHFIIPDALELEDAEKPRSDKDLPCVGGYI